MTDNVNTQAYFFRGLFGVLNRASCEYVVLHSWQTLPDEATHDVDMLISAKEKQRLPALLKEVENVSGWRFVQKLWYDVPWCFYFVAVSPDGSVSAALDFVSDPNGVGEYRIRDEAILRNRVFSGLLYHLSTEAELAYKLAKRRVKGIFRDEDVGFALDYFGRSDPATLRLRMSELLPQNVSNAMLKIVSDGCDLETMRRYVKTNSPAFVLFGRRWRIKPGLSWFVDTIRRIFHRIANPTGAIVYLKDMDVSKRLAFPAFVFRRERAVNSSNLTWRRRWAALSSATLLLVTGCEHDGFELGSGFVPFASEDKVAQILSYMRSRLETNH